jgi:hypothetical protein
LTSFAGYVRVNIMRASRFKMALESLAEAIRDVDAALVEMRADSDPLALHIFVSRRTYRNIEDNSKHGHHKERVARSTYREACELGFCGSFSEWERLMGAVPRR